MTTSSTDRIHKEISLRAAPSRVWRALTDAAEFGAWFGVALEGPIRLGEEFHGRITHPGYEHLRLRAWVERMEPERLFAFRWCPYALDPEVDYSGEPRTLVEFRLEELDGGTRLTVTESGFDGLPAEHRSECFLRNESGWSGQVHNVRAHVDG